MFLLGLTETDKKILSTVRKNPNSKKTRIAEISDIPWTTSNTAIDKLIKMGLLVYSKDGFGNETKELSLNADCLYMIGVSIGTSHIKVCVLDFSFSLVSKNDIFSSLKQNSIFINDFWEKNNFNIQLEDNKEGFALWCAETPTKDLLDVKKLMNDLCDFALELNATKKVCSIAFSFPGHIDNRTNTIIKSNNLNFQLINVGINTLFTSEKLKSMEIGNISICIEHNVKAAAIAERTIGVLKNYEGNSAVLYQGAGLGVAFWLNGSLYRGSNNAAGQLGHIKINSSENTSRAVCSCGKTGCLEQYIRDIFEDELYLKRHTSSDIAKWLDAHEPEKKLLVNYLIQALFNMNSLLEIECIVFSGKLNKIYLSIESLLQEKMIEHNQTSILFLPSEIGEFSASIGTAICGYFNKIDYVVN